MVKPLRVGIAGLGVVGADVIRLIQASRVKLEAMGGREIVIVAVCARQKVRRHIDISGYQWFDDPVTLASSSNLDVFVELIGGQEGVALASVEAALISGKHVVSANKALLSRHGVRLAKIAEQHKVALNFEGAIGGAIPIIKSLREQLAANSINAIYGVLNGTCNYILTTMAATDTDFDTCLKQAQDKGYAEADPSADIDGCDSAHKLALLAALGVGDKVSGRDFDVIGIRSITRSDVANATSLGYVIKLLAVLKVTGEGLLKCVYPALIATDSLIAKVSGSVNVIMVCSNFSGELIEIAPGAGGKPTASAVMGDIFDIARGIILPPFGYKAAHLKTYRQLSLSSIPSQFYLRLTGAKDAFNPDAVVAGFERQGMKIVNALSMRPHLDSTKNSDHKPQAEMAVIIDTTSKDEIDGVTAMLANDSEITVAQVIRVESDL